MITCCDKECYPLSSLIYKSNITKNHSNILLNKIYLDYIHTSKRKNNTILSLEFGNLINKIVCIQYFLYKMFLSIISHK